MEYLKDEQVVFVETYLKNVGVSDEALLNQLTDHISILIEMEIQSGKDFFKAFETVSKNYTSKTLAQIQSEIAINKHYPTYLTKSVILSIGIIIFAMLILGLYLRFTHLPYRKVFQFTGAIGFGYLFLPIYFLHQLMKDANKVKTVAQFVTAFIVFHSAFALVVRWPIAKFLVPTSCLLIILYFLIFYIITNPKIVKP
jgi:uncharacterized membrane protein YozB (DUF420 family)